MPDAQNPSLIDRLQIEADVLEGIGNARAKQGEERVAEEHYRKSSLLSDAIAALAARDAEVERLRSWYVKLAGVRGSLETLESYCDVLSRPVNRQEVLDVVDDVLQVLPVNIDAFVNPSPEEGVASSENAATPKKR